MLDLDLEVKYTGYITRYTFHNPDNLYSVARFQTEDGLTNMTIVGNFPKVSSDLLYEVVGQFQVHSLYGEQLLVQSVRKAEQTSNKKGLISYLSGPTFYGIGPKTAEKIVEFLGATAIEKILADKSVLKKIGINKVKSERIYQTLLENRKLEQTQIGLYDLDIMGITANNILARYGNTSLEVLNDNPYRLIDEVSGIGFIRADEIAKKLGLKEDDERRIYAAIIYALNQANDNNGHTYLYYEQVVNAVYKVLRFELDLASYLNSLALLGKIVVEDDKYFLRALYNAEKKIAERVLKISANNQEFISDKVLDELLAKSFDFDYTKTQLEAIKAGLKNPFTIITGGPGTGKTTIIKAILDLYQELNEIPRAYLSEYVNIMAPTGRAAKRMREILDFKATTIHKGLGFDYTGLFTFDKYNRLPQNLIIVDESSMIDTYLAQALFEAIKDDAQVILVGDVDQLPSVGPGQILKDLIASDIVEVVRLTEIHRQAKNSNIVKIASKINNQTINDLDLTSENDAFLYRLNPEMIKKWLVDLVKSALDKGYDIINDIQILIPMYKGDLGIDQINICMQEAYITNKGLSITQGDRTFYIKDKVIQLENDPIKDIMNGDIGYVEKILVSGDNKKSLIVNFDSNRIEYQHSDLNQLKHAYAISIHKSQGSEYPIVIIPVVKNYLIMLKKQLIYTAVTRTKNHLIIMGDLGLIKYASQKLSDNRQTDLIAKLRDNLNHKTKEFDDISPWDFM